LKYHKFEKCHYGKTSKSSEFIYFDSVCALNFEIFSLLVMSLTWLPCLFCFVLFVILFNAFRQQPLVYNVEDPCHVNIWTAHCYRKKISFLRATIFIIQLFLHMIHLFKIDQTLTIKFSIWSWTFRFFKIHLKHYSNFLTDISSLFVSYFKYTVKSVSNDHPWGPKIVTVIDRWSLLRGHLCCKSPILDPKMVVVLDRWLLAQVWLYSKFLTWMEICAYFYAQTLREILSSHNSFSSEDWCHLCTTPLEVNRWLFDLNHFVWVHLVLSTSGSALQMCSKWKIQF